jgi:dGTP triphosphohydrolase
MLLLSHAEKRDEKGVFLGFNCKVEDDRGNKAMVFAQCREHHSRRELNSAAFRAMRDHIKKEQLEQVKQIVAEETEKKVREEYEEVGAPSSEAMIEEGPEVGLTTREYQEVKAKEIMESIGKKEVEKPTYRSTTEVMKKYLDEKGALYGIQDNRQDLWKIIKELP